MSILFLRDFWYIYTFYEIEEMIFHSIQDKWLVACVWITIKDNFIWQLHSITMNFLHYELHKGCDHHCSPGVWHSFGDLVRRLMLNEWMIPKKCFFNELIEVSKLFFKVNQNPATFCIPFTLNWVHGSAILISSQHLEQSAGHLTCEGINEWVSHRIFYCWLLDFAPKDSHLFEPKPDD